MNQEQMESISEVFLKSKQSPMVFAEMIHLGLCDNSFMRKLCKRGLGMDLGLLIEEKYTLSTPRSAMDLENSYFDTLNRIMTDEEGKFFDSCSKYGYEMNEFPFKNFQKLKHDFQKERNQEISSIIIPWLFWSDVVCDSDYSPLFDPCTKHAELLGGYLGTIAGIKVYTDGYRSEDAKIRHLENKVYAFPEDVGVWNSEIKGTSKVTRDFPPEMYMHVDTKLRVY